MADERSPTDLIEEQMKEIAELVAEEKELQGYRDNECASERNAILDLEALIEKTKNNIEDLRVSMERRNPELNEQIALARREIDSKKNALKTMCYSLPIDILKKGLKLTGFNVSVTVSRTSVKTSYRTNELLKAHPELAHMHVDGDPVVTLTVDPAVLGRLVAEEKFDGEAAAAFRVETKLKNPSVRIIEEVENE